MRVYARQLHDQLPYLRRYARALVGSIELGDALVTRCVEAAMMAPERFGLADGSRAGLYALLHLLFDAELGRPCPSPHPIERALAALPEGDRRAYLLMTLEGMDAAEAGLILDIGAQEAAQRLMRARDAVRDRLTQRVLVVEDNPILALEMECVVSSMGHVVCGMAADEARARALAESERPTLALVDVRLGGGGSGVAVARLLRDLRPPGHPARTIFVTAHDDDLDELGMRHLGQVVRKPFTAQAIRGAIARAVFMPTPVALA